MADAIASIMDRLLPTIHAEYTAHGQEALEILESVTAQVDLAAYFRALVLLAAEPRSWDLYRRHEEMLHFQAHCVLRIGLLTLKMPERSAANRDSIFLTDLPEDLYRIVDSVLNFMIWDGEEDDFCIENTPETWMPNFSGGSRNDLKRYSFRRPERARKRG